MARTATALILAAALVNTGTARDGAWPTTAEGFTQLFARKNDRTWSGGDQSTSFQAPNGPIYWISADTVISDGENPDGSYPVSGTRMISNRVLLQTSSGLENAIANGGIAVPEPNNRNGRGQDKYWPQGAFAAGDYLYLLCQRVESDPTPGTLGFKLAGTDFAKYRMAPDGKLTFVRMVPTPSTGVPEGVGAAHIQWAADAVAIGPYVYIYGYTDAERDDPGLAAHYSYVARVPSSRVEDPQAWRFYRKSTGQWVRSMADLSKGSDNFDAILASQISSVRIISGKVVVAHKPWNGFGSAVYAEVGARAEGPFEQVKLFESPAGVWRGSRYWTYGPMLHPEQTLTGAEAGSVLISINWNGRDLAKDVFPNADLYKPRFHAVRLW